LGPLRTARLEPRTYPFERSELGTWHREVAGVTELHPPATTAAGAALDHHRHRACHAPPSSLALQDAHRTTSLNIPPTVSPGAPQLSQASPRVRRHVAQR